MSDYVVCRSDGGGLLKEVDRNGSPVFTQDLDEASKMQRFEADLQSLHLAKTHGLLAFAAEIIVTKTLMPTGPMRLPYAVL